MKYALSSLAFGLTSAGVLQTRQSASCTFGISVSGGVTGSLGQLADGQNRVGPGQSGAQYSMGCSSNGGSITQPGRGCILTPPTTQFQCDSGAAPTPGFTITSSGAIEYNGSGKFYACPADSNGNYNIYSSPVANQPKCVEVALSSSNINCQSYCTSTGSGSGSGPGSGGSSSSQITSCPGPSYITLAPMTMTKTATSSITLPAMTLTKTETSSITLPAMTITSTKSEIITAPGMTVTSTKSETVTAPGIAFTAPGTTVTSTKSETVTGPGMTVTAPSMTITSTKSETITAPGTTIVETAPAYSAPAASAPIYSAPAASASSGSGSGSGSSGSSSTCPADLSGSYQAPHLIISVDSTSPNIAGGTSYFGQVSSTVSSIFNFDTPASFAGKQCKLIFTLPMQSQLQTSSFTTSGSGPVTFKQLSSPASDSTTYGNCPGIAKDFGSFTLVPGNSYTIATGDCIPNQTFSYEMSASGDYALHYFQDYNPCPIGLYVVVV